MSHFLGKKPKNINLLVGKPAALRAAVAAEGPGMGETLKPAAVAARTILKPGSDINGVPASLTRATSAVCNVSITLPIDSASFQSRIDKYLTGVGLFSIFINCPVCLVSSQAMTVTEVNIFIARKVMSSRLPIGVATTYNMPMLDFILAIDVHLSQLIGQYGNVTYVILFGIIFVETGVVLMPFLPGDSLLFAAGALSALGSFNPWLLFVSLSTAAILGDTCNYWIGHVFGEKILANPKIPLNKEHLAKTDAFFAKHGGKTIFLARFVPIVRTFAPFVAGIGKMHYGKFITYNLLGGVVWVGLFTFAGYFFGNVPIIKHNFSVVIIAIVILSILPIAWKLVKR